MGSTNGGHSCKGSRRARRQLGLDVAITIEGNLIKLSHDPGRKVRLSLPAHVTGTALFGGHSDQYRYRLFRRWGTQRRVMFVMMNPSTADPLVDDPTVAKCRRLAVKWGYGSMYVGNIFAYRATDQGRLAEVEDPIGPDNDRHLLRMAADSTKVIFAYGQPKHRHLRDRGLEVVKLLACVRVPACMYCVCRRTVRHAIRFICPKHCGRSCGSHKASDMPWIRL
jgi:hypothetical protein